jgi:hypothetical protein
MKRRRHEQPDSRQALDLPALSEARELFWQNVMREMLTALAMQRSRMAAQLEAERKRIIARGEDPGEQQPQGFDGRMAVVTKQGERIPIADVTPIFACSIGDSQRDRALSEDVQCTVFQIRTPSGEVYTFPVGEIRGFHALSEEAMQTLQHEAQDAAGAGARGVPFGFAAYTSLSRELAASGADDSAEADGPSSPLSPETTD